MTQATKGNAVGKKLIPKKNLFCNIYYMKALILIISTQKKSYVSASSLASPQPSRNKRLFRFLL